MFKLLVCGSRNYDNYGSVIKYVSDMKQKHKELIIVQGGASGADILAKQAAIELSLGYSEYKPDWRRHGKGAGPRRNQLMIDSESPDVVVAFHSNIEESKGTKDMIARAVKHNIPYEVIE